MLYGYRNFKLFLLSINDLLVAFVLRSLCLQRHSRLTPSRPLLMILSFISRVFRRLPSCFPSFNYWPCFQTYLPHLCRRSSRRKPLPLYQTYHPHHRSLFRCLGILSPAAHDDFTPPTKHHNRLLRLQRRLRLLQLHRHPRLFHPCSLPSTGIKRASAANTAYTSNVDVNSIQPAKVSKTLTVLSTRSSGIGKCRALVHYTVTLVEMIGSRYKVGIWGFHRFGDLSLSKKTIRH